MPACLAALVTGCLGRIEEVEGKAAAVERADVGQDGAGDLR
jgi:hypothetical protein